MPDPTISASVGEDGTNKSADVKTIQRLLNQLPGLPPLKVDGDCSDDTIKAIHSIQMDFFNASDGLLEADGPTFKRLLKAISLGFVQLPQVDANEDSAGYYSYSEARKQFGTAPAIKLLQTAALAFHTAHPELRIGIGDISFRDGNAMPPHTSHRNGRNIDIRPMRKDGKKLPVTITDAAYDRAATRALVETLFATGLVAKILFNDSEIEGVKFFQGHHNHLHVETRQ